jgi:DnaJ-domain-containing protein 1
MHLLYEFSLLDKITMQNALLKRLEIIKHAVSIEEDDLIDMQLLKLKQLELDDKVLHIVALIESQKFEKVIQLIEQYKQDNSGLVIFEDPDIQGLKLELKVLESIANELSDEKVEIERQIHHFNSEYMLQLGELIEAILKLNTTLDNTVEEQQEAEQAYESFQQDHHEQLNDLTEPLTDQEKKSLKKAYRQASRLCHPDKLSDVFKEQGEVFFKALNEAYRRQDLKQVEQILANLESGVSLNIASDDMNDKELLQKKIIVLRDRISLLEIEIRQLQENETYQRIQSIDDMEAYFSDLKQALEAELEALLANESV